MNLRKLWVVGLVLVLLTPLAFAEPKEYSTTVEIDSAMEVTFDGSCSLEFPDDAEEPARSGTFYTNACCVTIRANKDVTVTFNWTQLSTDGYELLTDLSYRYRLDGGAWTAWSDDETGTVVLNFSHGDHQGFAKVCYRLSVHRNGYADHFGEYNCTLTVTVSG